MVVRFARSSAHVSSALALAGLGLSVFGLAALSPGTALAACTALGTASSMS